MSASGAARRGLKSHFLVSVLPMKTENPRRSLLPHRRRPHLRLSSANFSEKKRCKDENEDGDEDEGQEAEVEVTSLSGSVSE